MKITLNKIVVFFMATLVFSSSCQKDKQEYNADSDKGKVKLKMGGTSFTRLDDNISSKASNGKNAITSTAPQSQEVPFNDEYKIIATLIPVGTNQPVVKGSTRAESVPNGAVIEPLEKGIKYTINVTGKGALENIRLSKRFIHGVDDADISFDLAPGEYTLLAFDDDRGYTNNRLRWQGDIEVVAGKDVNLNIVLQNMFAQATVTLNTENIGAIQQIGSLYVNPVFYAPVLNFYTGSITYEGKGHAENMLYPAVNPSSSIWKSNPFVLKTGPNKAEISMYNVIINGIEGQIHLSGLTIEDGVKYDIQLKLGSKTDKTFKIAGVEFADANLYYDQNNDSYSFANADNAYRRDGYFFPNYVKPKVRGSEANKKPNSTINGNNGDPCELVQPLNKWRLPTKNEVEILLTNNKTVLSNFTYYPPIESSKERGGVFFGIETHPSDRYREFLFLPLLNYYTNSTSTTENPGEAGRYLLKNGSSEFAQLALSLYKSQGVISTTGEPRIINQVPEDMALSIRCVKK